MNMGHSGKARQTLVKCDQQEHALTDTQKHTQIIVVSFRRHALT